MLESRGKSMPDFIKSLQGRDLGAMNIIAELWGVKLEASDVRSALQRLAAALLDRETLQEIVSTLPAEARAALEDLVHNGGRLPWPLFTRRYGRVREMGAGRRDREQPHHNPVSPAEMLWYRALVARAFFDGEGGPEEFAYIPEDLLALLPASQEASGAPLGRPATPVERSFILEADDRILDHACTLLAALRLSFSDETLAALGEKWQSPLASVPLTPVPLRLLLASASMLELSGLPRPEPTRLFLESDRSQALAVLVRAWLNSAEFNELRLLPGVEAEGEWQNDPLPARRAVLDFLATVPARTEKAEQPFWSLPAFVEDIKKRYPDFLRPAGDYDSWFLRDVKTGEYLRGFSHWDDVDGGLIRYILTGPLHWLGILDLAAPFAPEAGNKPPVTAFRLNERAASLLQGQPPEPVIPEDETVTVRSDARLVVPRKAPRAARYQLARFGIWEEAQPEAYQYRLTPASLSRARQQGLSINHLLSLLRRHAKTISPSLVKALERWERAGREARLEQALVLRLSSPELLEQVRQSKAARFLGDPLGPTSVIVKEGAAEKVLAILAEMGILGEFD